MEKKSFTNEGFFMIITAKAKKIKINRFLIENQEIEIEIDLDELLETYYENIEFQKSLMENINKDIFVKEYWFELSEKLKESREDFYLYDNRSIND